LHLYIFLLLSWTSSLLFFSHVLLCEQCLSWWCSQLRPQKIKFTCRLYQPWLRIWKYFLRRKISYYNISREMFTQNESHKNCENAVPCLYGLCWLVHHVFWMCCISPLYKLLVCQKFIYVSTDLHMSIAICSGSTNKHISTVPREYSSNGRDFSCAVYSGMS
jgi:hypothetical protein